MENQPMLRVTAVSEEKTAKDGRKYYTVRLGSINDPAAPRCVRNIMQQKNNAGDWNYRGADQKEFAALVGKQIPGAIIGKAVEAFEVVGTDGTTRTAKRFTTALFGFELGDVNGSFKALGHPVASYNGLPVESVSNGGIQPSEAFATAEPDAATSVI